MASVGVERFGVAGVLAPVGFVVALLVLARPALAMAAVVGLTVVCEGPLFGLFGFTAELYSQAFKDISVLDGLVALGLLAVGLDVLRTGRPLWLPRATGAAPGAPVARDGGRRGHRSPERGHAPACDLSEHVLAYLLLIPIAVANLDLDRRQLMWILTGTAALAIAKAMVGLVEVAGHYGVSIEGTATLTYYEPAPNWLIMVVLLSVLAGVLARARPPLWMVLGSPLLLACLVLSYRRSFWIGAILAILLVVLLASTPVGRRLLVPAGLGLALAVWALSSLSVQSQSPVIKRFTSLSPSKLEENAEDRYRLDERENVLAEISQNPLTGIGVTIPWAATAAPLSVEHEEGRTYVHFAALWYWLKLGLLGLFAYVAVILGSMSLAWAAWRRSSEPLMRAFALGSLCAMVGLIAIDTTASFTGVDPRFTVLFAAQVGLLAAMVRTAELPRAEQGHTSPGLTA